MSLYGSFDRGAHLAELGTPLEVKGRLLSADDRRDAAMRNLVGSDAALPARFQLRKVTRVITNAELEALAATPVVLIPAPGVGKMILVQHAFFHAIFNGDAQDDATADGDLVLQYTGGTVAIGSPYQAAGFIDQANDEIFQSTEGWHGAMAAADVDNNSVELTNDGAEFTNGNTTLAVTLHYRVLDTIPV